MLDNRAYNASGAFDFTVPLHGPVTLVTLMAVGPLTRERGQPEQYQEQDFEIHFDQWADLHPARKIDLPTGLTPYSPPHVDYASADDKSSGKSYLSTDATSAGGPFAVAAGPVSQSFTQSDGPSFSGFSIAVKGDAQFTLMPNTITADISGSINALPISTADGSNIFFAEGNARVGYVLPFLKGPWQATFMGGVTYMSMFGTPGTYGYSNLIWPEIFPVVRYSLKGDKSVYAYFKYATLSSAIIDSANYAMSIGGGYVIGGWNSKAVSFMLDYSSLAYGDSVSTLSSSNISLCVGLQL